jgi:chitodextrinase
VGSYSATAPVSPAGSWIMQMIALRPSTGGPQLPTRPTGLAAAGSTTQINLAWSASTSSLGIANYIVQRCQGVGCTSFAQIATPVGTGYVDTGVIPNTSYSYQVQAIDTAGNLSQFSNIATAITQTSPPAGLASISLSSGTIVGGNPVTGTVTLTEPAGVNGAVVTLSSSNTTVASVPSTLTVPQGSTSATFSVTTKKVKSATAVVVSASYSGVSMNANLTVKR